MTLALSVSPAVIVLGAIIGLTYGILAVGLVLVYRSNRIINFAHGEIGAFGAAVFGLFTVRYGLPYYLCLPFALALSGGIGALAEVGVVRRLRNAPRLMSVVATLGVGQFLVLFSAVVNGQAAASSIYPQPPGLPVFAVGALRVTQAYFGMLLFTPLVVLALVYFLTRTRVGLAIRGAAANSDVARMAGIRATKMSSLSWAIAGGVSALTAILVTPTRGFISGETFGPGLLLRALVAAVIGRMTSLPIALAAGLGVGIVEQVLLFNYPSGGLVEAVLFVFIVVALVLQRGIGGRDAEKGSWAAVQSSRPLPDAYHQVWLIRNLGWICSAAGVALAVLLGTVISNSVAVTLTSIFAFVIVGLSVGIVAGLSGQLSLGQFALSAVGAVVSWQVSRRTGNFFLSFFYAGLGGAFASLLIGLPALRIRGLLLAVTTLSFGIVTPAWLLVQPWAVGEGVDPGRPTAGGFNDFAFDTGKRYYYVALFTLVVMYLLVRNVRLGGVGRRLIAVRDNEDNARAFTIPAAVVKIQGFMLAGFVAGVGGAVYGHLLSRLSASAFPGASSIDVVAMTVIGGIGVLPGPLLGALVTLVGPAFLPLDSAGLAASKLGQLLLILYLPAGLAGLSVRPLERLYDALARRSGVDVEAARDEFEATASFQLSERANRTQVIRAAGGRQRPPGTLLLRAVEVRKSFGGIKAVDGVSVDVMVGDTLGLIGPNGAGKTTFFELLSGFTRPDSGQVFFDGADITRAGPEARAQLGLIRSFQDAALFSTLTVLDAVRLATEKVAPTALIPAALGVSRLERHRTERARELVAFFGLDRYRNKQIQELSTGTRRITEIACMVALEPTLLLLDEPSSGIAQRETEALGALLEDLKRQLKTTLVIIEHDIPLIMGLANRIVAMESGHVIAQGPPELVRNDPKVVEAYLGGSITAIERSGTTVEAPAPGNGATALAKVGAAPPLLLQDAPLVDPSVVGPPPDPATSPRERAEARFSSNGEATAHDELPRVPGLGPARTAALLRVYGSVERIRAATPEELATVPGVTTTLAERLHAALHAPVG